MLLSYRQQHLWAKINEAHLYPSLPVSYCHRWQMTQFQVFINSKQWTLNQSESFLGALRHWSLWNLTYDFQKWTASWYQCSGTRGAAGAAAEATHTNTDIRMNLWTQTPESEHAVCKDPRSGLEKQGGGWRKCRIYSFVHLLSKKLYHYQ